MKKRSLNGGEIVSLLVILMNIWYIFPLYFNTSILIVLASLFVCLILYFTYLRIRELSIQQKTFLKWLYLLSLIAILPIIFYGFREYKKRIVGEAIHYDFEKKYDEAIVYYTKYIQMNADNTKEGLYMVYRERAEVFEKKGEFDKAISDYSKAIEIYPEDPSLALYDRASLYFTTKEYDKCWEDVNKLKHIKPTYLNSGFLKMLKKASGREE